MTLIDHFSNQCPQCDASMVRNIERTTIQYGYSHDVPVMLSFLAPIYTCLGCDSQYSADGYEEAEKKAINDYLGR
jgi:hypothetical protein